MLFDLSLEIVSTLLDSNRICGLDAICFIFEIARSTESMHKCAPQTIDELVLMRRVSYFTSILEIYGLASHNNQVDRVHVDTCRECGIACPAVEFVGTFHIDKRNRWMMANLLEMHRGSISHGTLHGLAEDGVQWFIEDVARM